MDIKNVLIEQDILKYIMNIKDEKLRDEILSQCKIIEYDAEDSLYVSTENSPDALVFLSGKVNIVEFVNESTDYTFPWDNNNWYGALSILAEDYSEADIHFLEPTRVLSFPLRPLLYSEPKENYELWMRVGKMAASYLKYLQVQSLKKAALSTEVYFLTSFVENGYRFENLSIPEISYRLKINTRTLQRLVQILEKKDLIIRDKMKKSIHVKDRDRLDQYLESIL